jgi:hypothetical protein
VLFSWSISVKESRVELGTGAIWTYFQWLFSTIISVPLDVEVLEFVKLESLLLKSDPKLVNREEMEEEDESILAWVGSAAVVGCKDSFASKSVLNWSKDATWIGEGIDLCGAGMGPPPDSFRTISTLRRGYMFCCSFFGRGNEPNVMVNCEAESSPTRFCS